ncbi:hypothetical protein BsWGS_23392 [Bradybaena similaris]
MDSKSILLIFSAMFINTECFRKFDKRQGRGSLDDPDCEVIANRCSSKLDAHPFIAFMSKDISTVVPVIDQICQDNQIARECVRPTNAFCHWYYREHLTFQLVDFLCSDRGRSLLREFRDSRCYQEFPNYITVYRGCLDVTSYPVRFDQSDKRKMESCIIALYSFMCGAAVEHILRAIDRMLFPQYYDNDDKELNPDEIFDLIFNDRNLSTTSFQL